MAATSALKAVAGALMAVGLAAPAGAQSPPPTAPFDYYVMTLSWSPGFCDLGGDEKSPQQCAAGAANGFVVHGLWPNNRMSADPENCDAGDASPAELATARGLYPSPGLARYEYRKHGTCTGLSAADYFAAVRTARDENRHPSGSSRARANRGVFPLSRAAGLRRRQRQSQAGEHGGHLRPRRAHRRPHLPFEGLEGLRRLPEGGGTHLPPRVDRRRAGAVSGARAAMNYRHAFHAGNFADVFKHAILARILVYLARKQAPFRFIDTHAGAGRYDLAGPKAKRSPEWREGVARLVKASPPASVAALIEPYLKAIGPHDASGVPASYPGSPAIAQTLMRPQDRIALCEAHPEEREKLIAALGRDGRLSIVGVDGYIALNAWLPPKERRGLVLIDPPFEAADELARVEAALARALTQMAERNLCRVAADPRGGRRRPLSQQRRRARRAEHPQARARRRAGTGRRARAGAFVEGRPSDRQPALYAR